MTDPMSSRAFDRSNRTVRQSKILPTTYGWRTAAQASDGPVDVWVDDMEGDWDNITDVVPVETLVIERTAADR